MKKIFLSLVLLIAIFAMTISVLAHETLDQADDTPLASPQALENALDNFFGAVENSGGSALNALLRNPTCHDHHTNDGIHPPGNP